MTEPMTERRFLAWLFGVAALAGLLVAAICWLVDPYLVFGRPRLAGFNDIKVAVTQREPMMKAHQASRSCGKTVILGSSRSAIGLDPDAPVWPAALRPVYNLSLAGSNLADARRLLQALLAHCGPDRLPTTLVIGLDFESFEHWPSGFGPVRPQPNRADQEQIDRLAQLASRDGGWAQAPTRLWQDRAAALLTTSAVVDSLATLQASLRSAGANLLANGKSSEWQLRDWTLADGAGTLFEQKHLLVARRYATPLQMSAEPGGTIRDMADVQALLDLAARHQMVVRLAVQPSHVSHHELLDALGFWPDFERWKRVLADTAQAQRQRGLDVLVWDFGGYETDYLEPVPARGLRGKAMASFWDPVHYRTPLGARIVSTLLTGAAPGERLATELRPDTVDQRLAQVRSDRAAWRLQHPEALAETQRLRCTALPCGKAASPR